MVFFITGGSRGIGEAVVLQAIREGHDVAFTYVKNENAANAVIKKAQAIADAAGQKRVCKAYHLDVASSKEVESVGDEVNNDFETVDAVVCNAAINKDNLVFSMSDEEWGDVIQTNLTGSFYVVRQFLGGFLANRFGRFVFLSSIAQNGISGQANYAASKAGLCGLSATLSKEYGRRGV
ncbi:MAG: SDR family NAD(P)-dependent oxidoreductase, partial [Deltaproteobacteria bacterium]